MNRAMLIEMFGYLGSALVLVSFLLTSAIAFVSCTGEEEKDEGSDTEPKESISDTDGEGEDSKKEDNEDDDRDMNDYLALTAGVACGATSILIPEVPYDFDRDVIERMKRTQKSNKVHFVILVSEAIGGVEEMAKRIQAETGVEARATILGHVQRGGSPTAKDRIVASQMGYYAVELLERGIGNRVVGMQNGKIVDFDIQEALSMKKPFELDLYNIANELSF